MCFFIVFVLELREAIGLEQRRLFTCCIVVRLHVAGTRVLDVLRTHRAYREVKDSKQRGLTSDAYAISATHAYLPRKTYRRLCLDSCCGGPRLWWERDKHASRTLASLGLYQHTTASSSGFHTLC